MKKKIFLVFAILSMLILAFAVSVNAEYNKSETVEITLADGTKQSCALYDAAGDELVWYTLDGGATVVSVKTKNLFCDASGNSLVGSANLTSIYLNAETPLQINNENTTNKVVVANLRCCTFAGLYHYSYKTTFSDSKVIEYVYLPSTIKTIDCNTFQYCSNLKVCDIPSDASFSIVSANNFIGCTSLQEINLVGCVTAKGSIFHSNFSGCISLTKVVIDPAVVDWPSIGGNTFANCPLTQFGLIPGECTIPESTTYIGDNAFQKSRFTKVNLALSQVESTGYNCFELNPNLTEVTFPTTLKTMGIRVFKDCPNLSTLVGFENTQLTTVSQETFYKSGVVSIVLPSTCTTIGYKAFADDGLNSNNTKLTSIVIPAGFVLIDDYAFQNCKLLENLIFAGDAGANAVIDTAAFENCKALEDVNLPYGIIKLENCTFKNAGTKNLTLPSTLKTLGGGEHFYGSSLETVTGLENTQLTSISYSMFRSQKNWKPDVVRIPDTVKSIGQYGFADCGATKFIVGTGMETIGTEAFVNCGRLKEVYLPGTVASISNSAFSNNISKNILFFVVSNDSEYLATVRGAVGATTNEMVDYKVYAEDTTIYTSGRYLITGVSACVAYYDGKHQVDENNKIVAYANGFENAGTCTVACIICGEGETETLQALFTNLGSSVPTYTVGSISIGYIINQEAIDRYYELTGAEVEYGVFAVSKENLGKNDIFDSEGNAAFGVIAHRVSIHKNTAFELRVSGFVTDEQKSSLLAMGAYVVTTKDGVSKYSYMQGKAPSEGEKYYFSSYNDVCSE